MTGFLDHLAGMALGAKLEGGARPALPARFAPRPPTIGAGAHGLRTMAQVAPLSRPAATARTSNFGDGREPGGAIARIEPPIAVAAAWDGRPFERPSREVLPDSGAAHPGQAPSRSAGLARPSPRPLFGDATNEAHAGAAVSASAAYTAAASPRRAPAALLGSISEKPTTRSPPLPVTRAAPLSGAVFAGRMTAARDERPVVHVTIDRIEVRAPAPQKPAAEQRRPRLQPTVSLSDYLRESARGGRG